MPRKPQTPTADQMRQAEGLIERAKAEAGAYPGKITLPPDPWRDTDCSGRPWGEA